MIMKFQTSAKITFFLAICWFISACTGDRKVDTSSIKVDVQIERFDQELSSIPPNQLKQRLPALETKYGVFYTDYFKKILNLGELNTPEFRDVLGQILSDRPFKDLQHETDSVFPNLDKQKPAIIDAFKHIKYHYPEWKVPKLITYISGFQVQSPIGVGYVGIGLDMFLGKESKFYPALVESVPRYISRRFTPENIAPRVVEVITREELFPELANDKSLLSKMVYNGKVLYFMNAVQPGIADSVLIGYSKPQMEWSKTFESDTWAFFLEQDLLYNTDYMKIQRYLAEAPFTPGLGEKNDSAPKLGQFIGWQIVKNYMEKNEDVDLKKLMLEKDAQKILRLAKYRPNQK